MADVKSVLVLDKWGMRASTVCAVHCALMPLLLTLIPFWGLVWLKSPVWETTIIGSSIALAATAHVRGFRIHGRCVPAVICLAGITILLLCQFFEDRTRWAGSFAAFAGLTVAASHWLNHRFCGACDTCEGERAEAKGYPKSLRKTN